MEGSSEESALEPLKGWQSELDMLLLILESVEDPALGDDTSGEYDSFAGTHHDAAAPPPEPEAAADGHQPQPGFFTHLMLDGELPEVDALGAWAHAEGGASLERTSSSSVSTATQAGIELRRASKRARAPRQPAEAPEAARPARRPRRRYREGEPRQPRGRPRVDPAKAYFRHLRSYSSDSGGIVGAAQRPAAA